MQKFFKDIDLYLCAIIILVILIMVTAGIISRLVTGESIIWVEEFSRILFIWAVLFGAAAGIKHDAHISIDTLFNKLSARGQFVVRVINFVIQFASVVFLIYSGYILLGKYGNNIFIVTGLPKKYLYVAWPLTGVLMLIRLLGKEVSKFLIAKE